MIDKGTALLLKDGFLYESNRVDRLNRITLVAHCTHACTCEAQRFRTLLVSSLFVGTGFGGCNSPSTSRLLKTRSTLLFTSPLFRMSGFLHNLASRHIASINSRATHQLSAGVLTLLGLKGEPMSPVSMQDISHSIEISGSLLFPASYNAHLHVFSLKPVSTKNDFVWIKSFIAVIIIIVTFGKLQLLSARIELLLSDTE